MELNMEAKHSRHFDHKVFCVDSDSEDSGTFSEARTIDWLLQQRQRSICGSCSQGKNSVKNETEISSQSPVTCKEVNEKDSVPLRTEGEICQLLKKQCPSTCS